MKWALNAKVTEVIVLDGIAIPGMFEGKREPMILSSDGQEADKANLLHDEVYNNKHGFFNTAFIGGTAGGLLSSCLSNGIACKALLISGA